MNGAKKETVQIDKRLFLDCFKIICGGIDSQDVLERASAGLYDKLEKMINRELYTVYKTAVTEEERAAARIKYLDRVGISRDFRWEYNSEE